MPRLPRRRVLAAALVIAVAPAAAYASGLQRPTVLTLSSSRSTVTYDAAAMLSGALTDNRGRALPGQTVEIQAHPSSSTTWRTAVTETTDSKGHYTWSAHLTSTTSLRAVFVGHNQYASSTSSPITVKVQASVGFDPDPVVGRGQKVNLGGQVRPATPGRQVTLQYLNGNQWRDAGSTAQLDNHGRWSISTSFSSYGDRTLRVVLASGPESVGGASPARTLRVTYPFSPVVTTGGKDRVDILRTTDPSGSCTIGLGRINAGNNEVELHPGSEDPGGQWKTPDSITEDERAGAVAGFNSGFKMKDAQGGFYLEHRQPYALRNGGATLALVSDGTWRLGEWGRDISMSSRIVAARQNVFMLVDNSQVLSSSDQDIQGNWGGTLHSVTYTWRTGLGIDPAGNLVFVEGPCLSPRLVGQALVYAGAVRGMELDVNPTWPTFDYYTASDPSSPVLTPHKLLSNETHDADHYFFPSTRDFFSVHLR